MPRPQNPGEPDRWLFAAQEILVPTEIEKRGERPIRSCVGQFQGPDGNLIQSREVDGIEQAHSSVTFVFWFRDQSLDEEERLFRVSCEGGHFGSDWKKLKKPEYRGLKFVE
jgi:hypothetical protein